MTFEAGELSSYLNSTRLRCFELDIFIQLVWPEFLQEQIASYIGEYIAELIAKGNGTNLGNISCP